MAIDPAYLVCIYGITVAIALKALTVGSDFSFYLWYKYGRDYVNFYRQRPSNADFLKRYVE